MSRQAPQKYKKNQGQPPTAELFILLFEQFQKLAGRNEERPGQARRFEFFFSIVLMFATQPEVKGHKGPPHVT